MTDAATPTAQSDRIGEIDIIRGFALFGVLWMNVFGLGGFMIPADSIHGLTALPDLEKVVGAITRLRDMGMEPYQLSSSLVGLMAQRLVRTLCKHCKQPYEASRYENEQLGVEDVSAPLTLYRAEGCPQCRHTGYAGRSGIHELIEVDKKLEEMIHDGASEQQLESYARTRTPGILQSGRNKVLLGLTTLREVLRVTIED